MLFCGEATHSDMFSTTHGAFLTGQRESERILKETKGSWAAAIRKKIKITEIFYKIKSIFFMFLNMRDKILKYFFNYIIFLVRLQKLIRITLFWKK